MLSRLSSPFSTLGHKQANAAAGKQSVLTQSSFSKPLAAPQSALSSKGTAQSASPFFSGAMSPAVLGGVGHAFVANNLAGAQKDEFVRFSAAPSLAAQSNFLGRGGELNNTYTEEQARLGQATHHTSVAPNAFQFAGFAYVKADANPQAHQNAFAYLQFGAKS